MNENGQKKTTKTMKQVFINCLTTKAFDLYKFN